METQERCDGTWGHEGTGVERTRGHENGLLLPGMGGQYCVLRPLAPGN